MQIILKEDVPHLGRAGQKLKVKEGYFRNYLGPKGLALAANSGNLAALERQQEIIKAKNQNQLEKAQSLAEKITALVLTLEKEAGEEGKLFGSVTSMEIAEALEAQNAELKIDRHQILPEEKIKAVGSYQVPIKLHSEVVTQLQLEVVAKAQ